MNRPLRRCPVRRKVAPLRIVISSPESGDSILSVTRDAPEIRSARLRTYCRINLRFGDEQRPQE